MLIRGKIEIEGVRFVVDIESLDGEREVFITNVSPSLLIIPKERWPIEFLELQSSTLQVLQEAGMRRLADLVDQHWQLVLPESLTEHLDEVSKAVVSLRSIALTFEPEPPTNTQEARQPFPIPKPKESEPCEKPATSSPLLKETGLPGRLCRVLENQRNVTTLLGLAKLGRRKTVLTRGIQSSDIDAIESVMSSTEYSW